jgi:hypothetical protein
MSPEALDITLSKVCPSAVELEIPSPDWNTFVTRRNEPRCH